MTVPSLIGQDAHTLGAAMRAGELSALELMRATLARIDQVNPEINAIVALQDREALMGAARLADTLRAGGGPLGWLHGIPVAVKDLVETKGIVTTQGSPLYARHIPEADAPLVTRLKDAGAIIIGKTNVPAFGLGSHSKNPVYGVTRNPVDRQRTAGGSSGGAAAAIATGMLPLADGSDMMGSLRNPAAWCDVYGFRPSVGVVTGDPGEAVMTHRLSTAGPMARTVADLRALLVTLSDGAFSPEVPGRDRRAVAQPRIGWLADWGGAYAMEAGLLETVAGALTPLEALGARIEPLAPPMPREALWESWCDLRSFALAMEHGALWRETDTRAHLNPQMIWEVTRGMAFTVDHVERASAIRRDWRATAQTLFQSVDILALPATQLWPFPADWDWPEAIAGEAMDSYHRWMEVVVPASLAGLPVVSVPAGYGPGGLPAGLQLIGKPGSDAMLLAVAERYAEAIGPRPVTG